jgi:hypothetical protein
MGISALHWAASTGSLECVQLLAGQGNAFPNHMESHPARLTPLDYAVMANHQVRCWAGSNDVRCLELDVYHYLIPFCLHFYDVRTLQRICEVLAGLPSLKLRLVTLIVSSSGLQSFPFI